MGATLGAFIYDRWEIFAFVSLVLLIMAAGVGEILYYMKRLINKRNKVAEFRALLIDWYNEEGRSQKQYDELVYRSAGVQIALGDWGIMDYKPPVQNYFIRNWHIVLNALPEIYNGLNDRLVRRLAHEHMKMLDSTLLRFLGHADEVIKEYRAQLTNPFNIFARGMKLILSAPILILLEFGLISRKVYVILVENLLFRLFVLSVSIITVLSGIMTVVLGWSEFVEFVVGIRNAWFDGGS